MDTEKVINMWSQARLHTVAMLFGHYAVYVCGASGEHTDGITVNGCMINNIRYADETMLVKIYAAIELLAQGGRDAVFGK